MNPGDNIRKSTLALKAYRVDAGAFRAAIHHPLDPHVTKIVPTWLVGQRNAFYVDKFVSDLAGRLVVRPQVTTDGLKL